MLVGISADSSVIRVMPPLILEQQHMEALIDALGDLG
jgi:4-aminobutyrate aminotransferase-like enzyme